jgi:hypothetical protein
MLMIVIKKSGLVGAYRIFVLGLFEASQQISRVA